MISKILPVAALAGVAIAASTCPLSVEISGTTDHIAQVAVTNTGAEAITVFKGNTVLSDHATLDLVASANAADLEFKGTYVNYKRTGLNASMFQVIQAGETVTASVNAAKTYNLEGLETVDITAIQGFRYVTGEVAPASIGETTLCGDITSNTVTITPDQSKVSSDLISRSEPASMSRIQKRAVTYSSCSTAQTSSLKTTVSDAITLATNAYTAAGSAADYFTTWFKSTSEETLVRSIYTDVKNVQTKSPKISCTDTYGDCSDGSALLYTVPTANVIVPCPNNGYWGFPEYSSTCADFDYDRAGSLLHEMTHLYGTEDWAYGPAAAKGLSAANAANNADTYEMYAGSTVHPSSLRHTNITYTYTPRNLHIQKKFTLPPTRLLGPLAVLFALSSISPPSTLAAALRKSQSYTWPDLQDLSIHSHYCDKTFQPMKAGYCTITNLMNDPVADKPPSKNYFASVQFQLCSHRTAGQHFHSPDGC
ncbi:putative Neutral protease 2 like protein [Sclerotinia borealis F-4128]|uniref:deuterolysin n=1 Tax=Sclerotinia borealis (strain F-4128) TaxID=1432307 RepID=W9CPR4_SCLBF|nr:putative Neutral protease 2 like protein [Sclerotinia borealis F-4128]